MVIVTMKKMEVKVVRKKILDIIIVLTQECKTPTGRYGLSNLNFIGFISMLKADLINCKNVDIEDNVILLAR